MIGKAIMYVWQNSQGEYVQATSNPRTQDTSWTVDINEAHVSHMIPPRAHRFQSLTKSQLSRHRVTVKRLVVLDN
jgi:hypothetical protein